ncbi:hypothetical protein ACEPAF_7137 [Sanghuangporus sanghuang]
MTDLATAVALALQAAGEGANQGSKVSKKVHVARPRDFDGEHDYVDFKRELRLYIYASESEFRTNKSKIMFALSYMKSGAAARWAESYTSGAVDADGNLTFTDAWDAFLKKLDTSFDDPARSQKAFERLDAMYQGDLNADEFFNKFDICRIDAGLATEAHDEWLMSRLKRALNPKVVEGVMRLPNEPTSYEEFKKAAVKVDRVERQIRDLMAERRRNSSISKTSRLSEVGPARTTSRSPFHPQPIKVELTDEQRAALPANSRWSASRGHYIVKAGNQVFGAWWDETAKRWYSQREGRSIHWRVKQEDDVDEPSPPTLTQPTAPLPEPSGSTTQALAPTVEPSPAFGKFREPAPLIPSEEDEEEEEEHEMSLSKEAMTDLATAVALALQAAGEGANQGSKVSKKVHVAKPRDFNGEHDYVDFKRELRLYIYASESEFRTNKSKIMFALSYMKSGAAARWAESYTSGAVDADGNLTFTDAWDAFLKKLDTSFDDPARSQMLGDSLTPASPMPTN